MPPKSATEVAVSAFAFGRTLTDALLAPPDEHAARAAIMAPESATAAAARMRRRVVMCCMDPPGMGWGSARPASRPGRSWSADEWSFGEHRPGEPERGGHADPGRHRGDGDPGD